MTIESTTPLDPQSGAPIEREPALVDLGADLARERTGGNRDITGLAARVRSERETAEMTDPTKPGVGIAPEASVQRGNQLRVQGVDPEKVLSDFEKTKRFSSDDVAVIRSKTDELARATNETEEFYGTDSPETRAAKKVESDWAARTKTLQTEWAKSGHAQQGQVDIDTGTFSGLARAYRDSSGKEFTPKQETVARKLRSGTRKANTDVETAKETLFNRLDKEFGGTDAEKRALDAANKTVRDAARRLADAENRTRVAKAGKERAAAKVREGAARKAVADTTKAARDAATKLADAENKARIKEAARPENVQEQAAKDALAIVHEVHRAHAERLAKAENKARVAKSAADKKAAGEIARAEAKRLKGAQAKLRKAAIDAADAENKARIARADTGKYLWSKAKAYIDAGERDLIDITRKVATETGRPIEEVRRELARPKGVKKLTDDLYLKQQTARRLHDTAKRWVAEQTQSGLSKFIPKLARGHFGLKTYGHGFVGMGTHAPMMAFQPHYWKVYAQNFGRMYHMVFKPAQFEVALRDLEARPNFVKANRAGTGE